MAHGPDFLPLLAVLLLAFLVPPILARVRWVPVVVGEIIAGIIVGRTGLNLIRPDATLDFLAEIGLALLMFLSGLEIDFSLFRTSARPRRPGSRPIFLAATTLLLSLGLAGVFGWMLVRQGLARDPWMIALILSTTSLGVVLPVLKERGVSAGPFGQTVLLAALLADFLTMFLITIHVAVKSRGLGLDILLVGVLFVAALGAYRLGVLRARRAPFQRAWEGLTAASSPVKVQGSVALLMGFVLLAKFLGAEMILGAFLAGVVLSLLTPAEDLQIRPKLDAIGFGFFIPLFFITVGIRFDLPSLLRNRQTWVLAPLLLGAAFVVKILPALLLKLAFSWRETLAAGFILSARLSLIIAAAGIGLSLGVIGESTHAAFILIAAVSSTLAPLAFARLLPSAAGSKHAFVLLAGGGDLGRQVADELMASGQRVVFLEPDVDRALEKSRAGFPVFRGESLAAAIPAAELPFVQSLLILEADDSLNLIMGREASVLGIKHVIALVNDPRRMSDFREAGVQTFAPAMFQSTILALMARNPDLFGLLTSARKDHEILEMTLMNPSFAGRPIRALGLGGNALVLSIRRDKSVLIPHGQTTLERGDHLTLLGSRETLRAFQERLEARK
jgi:Kef-type K+ transport system membrane component KefB/Trk K+ transport system NAD-binding subunit